MEADKLWKDTDVAAESLDPVVVGALIRLRDCNTVPPMNQSDIEKVGLTFRRLVKSGIDYHPDLKGVVAE